MDCATLISSEYLEIVKIVGAFDARLLTIKGWAVTFSLATLALAFQQKNRGLFLAVLISALSFWLLEASVKGHQMRYYPRMAEIEIACHTDLGPRINSSWMEGVPAFLHPTKERSSDGKVVVGGAYWLRWFLPHVMLPHLILVLISAWFIWRDPGANRFLGARNETS
ncbi:hypothetical protein JZU46_04070 [bacterium]|jgi:hypothetical protein|nr:hypothetical protein [bacterium]